MVLVLIIKTSIVYCQEETGDYDENNNSVSLKTGYGAIRIKDRVISTFAYSGNSVPVQIDYYHTGSKIRFNTTYTLNASGTIEAVTPTLDGFSYKGDYGTSIENTIGTLDHKTIESKFYVFEMELLFKLAQLTNKLTMFSGVSYNNIRMDKKYLMLEYTNNSNSKY